MHYVNVRFGAAQHLTALATKLEIAERHALCWCAAAHIQGVRNVIADLGSRLASFPASWAGDRFANAMLRKPLFLAVARRLGWNFTVDLFADREGRTALAPRWYSAESSGFEAPLDGETVWCHPPPSLLASVFKWVDSPLATSARRVKVAILAPLDEKAPWFHPRVLSKYKKTQTWAANSDLFRWVEPDGSDLSGWRWRKGPRPTTPYAVFTRSLPP